MRKSYATLMFNLIDMGFGENTQFNNYGNICLNHGKDLNIKIPCRIVFSLAHGKDLLTVCYSLDK